MKLLEDYKVITITHHNLNVDELGYFVIKSKDKEDLKSKLDHLKFTFNIDELIYLSTCKMAIKIPQTAAVATIHKATIQATQILKHCSHR